MVAEQLRAVHPIAAVFPMLPDAELDELAAHIRANGLLNSIKLGPDGAIWDGRNRSAACDRAGVEPWYETVPEGTDALAYILGQNDHRRHNSTGQRAMAAAMAIKEDEELCTSAQSVSSAARAATVERSRVSQALTILEWAPDLAALVLDGTRYLKDTYAEARRRKSEKESQAEADARALRDTNAKTERLRKHAPDLADLVAEWRLPLDEATDLLDKREAEENLRRRRDVGYMVESTMLLRTLLYRPPSDILEDWLDGVSPHQQDGPFSKDIWRPAGLRDLATSLMSLATEMERREER